MKTMLNYQKNTTNNYGCCCQAKEPEQPKEDSKHWSVWLAYIALAGAAWMIFSPIFEIPAHAPDISNARPVSSFNYSPGLAGSSAAAGGTSVISIVCYTVLGLTGAFVAFLIGLPICIRLNERYRARKAAKSLEVAEFVGHTKPRQLKSRAKQLKARITVPLGSKETNEYVEIT